MNKSILNMNWTQGNRELETATELDPLEAIAVRMSLAYELQSPKQDESNRLIGNNIEADSLHQLIEHVSTDPAHILNAEQFPFDVELKTEKWIAFAPKLPPAQITTLQQLADAKDRSFNRRYYGNQDGMPEWERR